MDLMLKSLHVIIITMIVFAILLSIIKSYMEKNAEKEIVNNPCYTEAKIIDIIPGTPSSYGIVNITVRYKFVTSSGTSVEKDNVLTAIKTKDLSKFKVGTEIPVVYAKNDPEKNMLNMKNEFEEFKR